MRGIGRSFRIGDGGSGSPATLVDISTSLRGAAPSNNPGEYDATCYQPGVANPQKEMEAGFADRSYALELKWSPTIDALFESIDGHADIPYEDGPAGRGVGAVRISGLCTVMGYSGANPPVDGIITATATLRLKTRVVDTFPA